MFYGEGLGLAADPGSTAAQRGGVGVTWYNIGRQQVTASAQATGDYLHGLTLINMTRVAPLLWLCPIPIHLGPGAVLPRSLCSISVVLYPALL